MSLKGGQNEFTGRHGDGWTESKHQLHTGKDMFLSHALEAGGTYGDTQIIRTVEVAFVLQLTKQPIAF